MKNSAIVTIPSHPKYLCLVRDVAGRMGQLYGMNENEIDQVKLAIDEACSNVIKYAYGEQTENKIVIQFKLTNQGFEVILEDEGKKAEPNGIKGRDLGDVRPGGLGIHLIKRAFDVYSFERVKKRGNRLRLVRRRKENNGH